MSDLARDLDAMLAATPPAPPTATRRQQHRTGREYEWDGNHGWLQTEPLGERPKTWDEFIRDAGLDPEDVEVIEPVQVRGWDGLKREIDGAGNPVTGVVRLHYYRLNLRRRGLQVDIGDLISDAKRRLRSSAKTEQVAADFAFTVALGDLQLGKMDGDGVEGTVERFFASTQAAVERYKALRRRYGQMPIRLFHLGDCIEGHVSQGGANTWRTPMTTSEQVRLYRRLLMDQVKTFAALTPELVVAGVPGNHDEAHRPLQTYGDSWAIDALAAVHEALEFAGGYEHVSVLAPARDELVLTLDVYGTIVGLAHGHQFGNGVDGWKNWLKGEAYGRQPIGDVDILFAGHKHHLKIQQDGGHPRPDGTPTSRTLLQSPALESGSQWWKHRTGEWGKPGILNLLIGGGEWRSLEIL